MSAPPYSNIGASTIKSTDGTNITTPYIRSFSVNFESMQYEIKKSTCPPAKSPAPTIKSIPSSISPSIASTSPTSITIGNLRFALLFMAKTVFIMPIMTKTELVIAFISNVFSTIYTTSRAKSAAKSNILTIKKIIETKPNDIIIPTIQELNIEGNDIIEDANSLFDYINNQTDKEFVLQRIKKRSI